MSQWSKKTSELMRIAGTPGQRQHEINETIKNSHLVSLKNAIALVQFPAKAAFYYKIYDGKNNSTNDNHFGNELHNVSTLVLIDSQSVYYYVPGMNDVKKIQKSDLIGNETYLKFEGLQDEVEASFASSNSIKISVYDRSKILSDRTFIKIGEKILLVQ